MCIAGGLCFLYSISKRSLPHPTYEMEMGVQAWEVANRLRRPIFRKPKCWIYWRNLLRLLGLCLHIIFVLSFLTKCLLARAKALIFIGFFRFFFMCGDWTYQFFALTRNSGNILLYLRRFLCSMFRDIYIRLPCMMCQWALRGLFLFTIHIIFIASSGDAVNTVLSPTTQSSASGLCASVQSKKIHENLYTKTRKPGCVINAINVDNKKNGLWGIC